MKLSAYTPPAAKFPIGSESISLRGLSLNDLSVLVNTNLEDFDALYQLVMEHGKPFTKGQRSVDDLNETVIKELAVTLARSAPRFAVMAIALAAMEADEDLGEVMQGAARLSMAAQIGALIKVAEMTFIEVGGVKKFFGLVGGLLSGLKSQSSNIDQSQQQTA